jgi:hypothetical protein
VQVQILIHLGLLQHLLAYRDFTPVVVVVVLTYQHAAQVAQAVAVMGGKQHLTQQAAQEQ